MYRDGWALEVIKVNERRAPDLIGFPDFFPIHHQPATAAAAERVTPC